MNAKDTKKTFASGSARPLIAPKNVVSVATNLIDTRLLRPLALSSKSIVT